MSLTPSGVGLSCVIFSPVPLALFPRSGILFTLMAEKLDPKEIVTLEELAISNKPRRCNPQTGKRTVVGIKESVMG